MKNVKKGAVPVYKTVLKKGKVGLKRKPILPINENNLSFPVIGIGGSAGSFSALEQFFKNTPVNIGMAFIIVMHLDPTKKGMMPELLQRYTKMKVQEAEDGEIIKINSIYIIPPARISVSSTGGSFC